MKLIALAITILSITSVFANDHSEKEKLKSFSISGTVTDESESLTGVKIVLDGKERIVYTDFEGNFTLDNVVAGKHTISLSLITYNNKEITFNPAELSNLEIELKEK